MHNFHLPTSLQQMGSSPRSLKLGTRSLPTQMAHYHGTDTNALCSASASMRTCCHRPSACPMYAILEEMSVLKGHQLTSRGSAPAPPASAQRWPWERARRVVLVQTSCLRLVMLGSQRHRRLPPYGSS